MEAGSFRYVACLISIELGNDLQTFYGYNTVGSQLVRGDAMYTSTVLTTTGGT
jgi:hypothetical protein